MSRNICITAVEGQTGFLIAELLLKEGKFARQISSLTGLALDPSSPRAQELTELGGKVVHHQPGRERVMVKALKEIGSAGCDYADSKKQPRLREFIDIESAVLATKGDAGTPLGHSPCVIRAGFYAENLLLYSEQAKADGVLPLPIGESHKFAPVALGDIAHVAAHVLAGKGKHGFDDRHRGQMMIVTGPQLCAGEELAQAASQALGVQLEFENISE
ncbi:hypothetical protein TsFJ059_003771 [Trichoderma semiorbis]|uniref:NmrA-like domain-containing protein n=1 Tax=Trichoderma semiorbis TaxID=1491008 RepID=A0A9P8HUF1_9HYPO|nr:hypothetical protein TsFJ059_003771 [Trichoderma semiorbis]